VEEEVKKTLKEVPHHVEGKELGRWVVLDYGDTIVHIMLPDVRDYYGIDWLWSDAKKIEFNKENQKEENKENS
jgi:ribosome-associated protein